MNPRQRTTLLIICAFSVLCGRDAYPAIFNIANGDVAALKSAIIAANANGEADTINLAPVGSYTLTAIDNSVNGANGLPVIISDVAGLDLTINGNGATIQRSTAPGTPEFRILQVGIGAAVNGNGLTIANGKVSGSFPAEAGAGILNSGATLALTDCVLRENAGGLGGGLYNDGGVVTLNTCTLDLNNATDSGAGITTDGQLTLLDSRLINNSTFATSGRAGAGLLNLGTTTLQRCIVKGNKARAAGGGIQNYGALTVESSTFDDNHTLAEGGAISTYPNAANSSAMTLLNSTFSNNGATYGGGISNIGATLILRNSTVRGNSATHAGGLYNLGGSSTVQCNTFSANSAPDAGGIYNLNTGAPTTLLIRNTILQTGSSGVNLLNENGVVTSEGYNLSSDGAGATGTGPGGLLNGPGDMRNTNPNLGPLQNNGGPTFTHSLLSPSPAIDAGDDAVLDLPLGLTTDQRGSGFPRRKGLHVDIGAVESGLSLTVTTVDDHNDGACTQTDCTLREAITATNMAGGGTVSFAPGVAGTIQLAGALPAVSANLFLQGPGANLLTVRRNSGGDYRIFTLSNGTNTGPAASITGLTISNGQASTSAFPNSSGGGILNDHGSLFVSNCILADNRSFLPASTYGGGIFNHEGNLTVNASTLSGNSAAYGGGIASNRSVPGTALIFITSSTISGNTSEGGNGGGIYCQALNAGAISDAFLTNCTLSGNSSTASGFTGGAGGAIFNFGSLSGNPRLSVEDCTLSGNNAFAAGGIYNNSFSATAVVTLRNTVLKTGAIGENIISAGTVISLGHNLADDFTGDITNPGTGPGGYLNASGDIRNTDPLLGPLQNNGGHTFTHALLNGSPAINAGINTSTSEVDQRGFPRVSANDIGAFEFGSVSPAPAVVSAVSRKLHAGAPFDIDLPFVGEVGIECRSGGANNDYQVVVSFANAVTYTGASVSFGAGSVSSSTGSGTNSITVNLTGMTSGQTSTITLGAVSDGVNTGDVSLLMAVLVGDTNDNGSVNAGDTLQTRSRSGQATDSTNFRSDVNADGFVNSGDTAVVRSRSGTALPP